MKSIELTEKQKSKLLEMCKVLLPEYSVIVWEEDINDGGLGREYLSFYNADDVTSNEIHWFEFCFTTLIVRLQNLMPDALVWREQPPYVGNIFDWKEGNKWTLYSEFLFIYPKACMGGINNPKNPIDWIYIEFKKLKL